MQLFCPVDHPLRKDRTALRNLALRDRPVFNPATTLFSDEGVWQAVSLIAERILQRDEAVSPLVTVQVPACLVLDKSGRISHATVDDCENWATNCRHRWPC